MGIALLAAPLTARAQSSVLVTGADIRLNPALPESNGIKVGEGRLHPFIELDSHEVYNAGRFNQQAYSPNLPLANGTTGGIPKNRENDFYFVVRPGMDFKLPSPKLDISATGYAERQEYVRNTDFSSWQGGLGGNLHWNKEGPLQLRVSQLLSRTAEPGNQTYTLRFNHWTNSTSLGIDIIPGGGALKLSADMNIYIDDYDHQQPQTVNGALAGGQQQFNAGLLNNQRYTPTLRASWDFLPKTSVFVEGSTTFTNFNNTASNAINGDSWIYSGYTGLNGQVTPKISAMAKVGYTGITAMPPGTADRRQNTVGALLEATWDITPVSKVRVGGLHAFEPVSVFLFSTMWKAYVRLDQSITTRFHAALGTEYYHLSYAGDAARSGGSLTSGTQREDNALDGNVAFSYFLTEFVTISLIDRIDIRHSNFQYVQKIRDTSTAGPLPINYVTNDVFLRLSVRY